MKGIFGNIRLNKYMQLIKYNKALQKKMNLSTIDYKKYNQIEIELKPDKKYYISGKFINTNLDNESHIHIFNNNGKKEIDSSFFEIGKKIKKLRIILDLEIKSFKGLFKNCNCIKEIKFIRFNRKDITDMSEMFCGCNKLIKLDLSNFNTDKVTNMSKMFYNCSLLEELNLNNFNTSNVINMESMFYQCSKLKSLNFSTFKTDKVTNMEYMFDGCSSLEELNLSGFKTDLVTNMEYMFSCCEKLKKLNIINFNTSKVINMTHMFSRCYKLIDLDLSNFEINEKNKYNYMFSLCNNDLKESIIMQNMNFESDAFQDEDFKSRFSLDDIIFDYPPIISFDTYFEPSFIFDNIYRDNNEDN